MIRRTLLLIVGLGAALVLASGVACAKATPLTVVGTGPVEDLFPLENPCNGELLTWSGEEHEVEHVTDIPNGSSTYIGRATVIGTAVGAESGDTYLRIDCGPGSEIRGDLAVVDISDNVAKHCEGVSYGALPWVADLHRNTTQRRETLDA